MSDENMKVIDLLLMLVTFIVYQLGYVSFEAGLMSLMIFIAIYLERGMSN